MWAMRFMESKTVAFLLIALSARSGRASEFCAVTVAVTDEQGRFANSVPVELHDPEGKTVKRFDQGGGEVKFCDFGFGEHSILVGNDVPGSIVIRRVSLVYGVEQRFHVIAPNRIERFSLSKEALCTVYLRVSSSGATPISNANSVRSSSITRSP